eukprot:467102-Pleurochrysis_carterae.AAC.1
MGGPTRRCALHRLRWRRRRFEMAIPLSAFLGFIGHSAGLCGRCVPGVVCGAWVWPLGWRLAVGVGLGGWGCGASRLL